MCFHLRAFIFCSLLLVVAFRVPAQEIRSLDALRFTLEDYPFTIGEVTFSDTDQDCFGVANSKGTKEWTPLYFEGRIEESLSELLHSSVQSRPGSDTIDIRIHRFFLTQNTSVTEPKRCHLDLQMDILRGQEVYSFGTSAACEFKMLHALHEDLIPETFRSILQAFKKVDSAGSLEMLIARSHSTEAESALPEVDLPDHAATLGEAEGIYWTFGDYLQNELDTRYAIQIKKRVDSTFYKMRPVDFYEPKNYWGYRSDGSLFYNIRGNGVELREEDGRLLTTLYTTSMEQNMIKQTAVSLAFLTGGLIGGVIAANIAEASDKNDWDTHEMEIDPLTGALVLRDHDITESLKNHVILYHTQFSKADSITVYNADSRVVIPPKGYARVDVPVTREGSYLILDDGMSKDTLTFKNIDRTADRFLIKSRKGQVSSQFLSTRDFESLPKEEVEVEYLERP